MDSIQSRYSNALIILALEEDKLLFYKEQIKMLKKLFLENSDILHLFSSYFINDEEKEKVVDTIYNNNENIKNFIKVIIKNRRTNYLIKIFDEFILTANEKLNVKDGTVYSVNQLTDKQIKEIQLSISKKLNCNVELQNIIDERLMGGIKVIVEDKVFDGSIKNRLQRLNETLKNGGK